RRGPPPALLALSFRCFANGECEVRMDFHSPLALFDIARMRRRIAGTRFYSPPAHSRSQNGVASLAYAQRVVGRGIGGLRPPYYSNTPMRSIGYGWGALQFRSPHPGSLHWREIHRPSPPLRGGRETKKHKQMSHWQEKCPAHSKPKKRQN